MIQKIEAHRKVIDTFQAMIQEEHLPVNISIGEVTIDCNGDTQVCACLEYDKSNELLINEALTKAVNLAIDLIAWD